MDNLAAPTINRLAAQSSPYLRQHSRNPVHWYPWGAEALDRARQEGKPVLLSIGYAACHWCHVMAHESFEDPATAAIMNRLYINIKVTHHYYTSIGSNRFFTATELPAFHVTLHNVNTIFLIE